MQAFKRNNALIDSWHTSPLLTPALTLPPSPEVQQMSKGDHHAIYIWLSTLRPEGRQTLHKNWTGSNRSTQELSILVASSRPSIRCSARMTFVSIVDLWCSESPLWRRSSHVTVAALSPAAERGELTNLGNRFARISTRSCLRAVRAIVTRAEISQRRESDRYCWTS